MEFTQEIERGLQGDPGGLPFRITVDSRADRRKGQALTLPLDGQFKTAPVRPRQQGWLSLMAAVPDRADRMEDVPGGKATTAGRDGTSHWTPIGIKAIRLLEQLRSGPPVDRAVDTAPSGQLGVGRIRNRIDRLEAEIALQQFDPTMVQCDKHGWEVVARKRGGRPCGTLAPREDCTVRAKSRHGNDGRD